MADQQQITAATTAAVNQSPAMSDAAMNILHNISQILDTGLDKETLRLLTGLVEAGVNPEALALIVKELRREGAAVGAAGATSQ